MEDFDMHEVWVFKKLKDFLEEDLNPASYVKIDLADEGKVIRCYEGKYDNIPEEFMDFTVGFYYIISAGVVLRISKKGKTLEELKALKAKYTV